MILIKNSRVIDPANNIDGINDILLDGTRIVEVKKGIRPGADTVIDASEKIVMPGIVDMHVHLREPGREDKETIASGSRAAAKGGVTSMLAMPNTMPAIDSPENVNLLQRIAQKDALVNVFISAAITKGRAGKELTDLKGLKKEGAIAVSDDGLSVDSAQLMSEALKRSRENGLVLISHCEDKSLSGNGSVNLGIISTRLGLKGIAKAAEYKRVERDILLAAKARCPLHITHVSCKESVGLIAEAKRKGLKVTADTAPHYFSLSEEVLLDYDTNMKMNPPLRGKEDVSAIKEGLRDGTIDAIASDHAPHTENEKEIEFERAEFGVIGLETELSVAIQELVEPGLLKWRGLVEKLALNPARILGIPKGTLGPGCDADLIILSPQKEWLVEKKSLVSKSKNTPFLGRRLKAVVEYTICSGDIVYKNLA